MDNVLGALAGVAKAMLVIMIIFSCASLLPAGSKMNKAFHQDSRTGRCVVPVLHNVFQHTAPTARQQAAPRRNRAKKDRAKTDQRRQKGK